MKLSQFLKRLNITTDPKLQRSLILEAWETCEQFFVGLQFSSDPHYQVQISKIIEMTDDDGYSGSFTFEQFVELFGKATDPKIDPEEIKKLILAAANECNFHEWNLFYRKILLKKLHKEVPMDIITDVLAELTGYEKPV